LLQGFTQFAPPRRCRQQGTDNGKTQPRPAIRILV
jgi:hypothetical protein